MITSMIAALAMSGAAPTGISKAAADAQCKAGQSAPTNQVSDWNSGLHPGAGGVTPATVPRATRVSVEELRCLIDAYGKERIVGITPITEEKGIPGTWRLEHAWEGQSFDDRTQVLAMRQLHYVVGSDLDRPMAIYCHSTQCFMSYNLALRAAKAGYRNIYWLRGGMAEWESKGGTLAPIGPAIAALGEEANRRVACYIWTEILSGLKLVPDKPYKAFAAAQEARLQKLVPQPALGDVVAHTVEYMEADLSEALEVYEEVLKSDPKQAAEMRRTNFVEFDDNCRALPDAPAGFYPK